MSRLQEKARGILAEKGFVVERFWFPRGYWRTNVCSEEARWRAYCEGGIEVRSMTATLTDCVRLGFTIKEKYAGQFLAEPCGPVESKWDRLNKRR